MADINQIRQGLLEVDIAVHTSWKLGKNMVVGWRPAEGGIEVCVAPCYRVLGLATANPRLLNGRRIMGGGRSTKPARSCRRAPCVSPSPSRSAATGRRVRSILTLSITLFAAIRSCRPSIAP